jgi:hypothetical protein
MKIFFKILVFSVLAFFSGSTFCLAQNEKVGLSLDQSIFSFNIFPGQKQEFVLNIKNIIEKEQRVSLEVKDFSVEENNKTSFLAEKNEIYGMKDWIRTDENVWILQPGEERRIKFIIDIPGDASVGSHYSATLFKALPIVDAENFQKPIVGGQIGTYFFVNVLGDISGKGKIENFEAPVFVEKQANFKVDFKNEGNVHYIPHGGIEIKNILNGEKTDDTLGKHFVFPGKSFSFEYNWKVPSAFGVYTAKAYFIDQDGRNLEEKRLIFGKYFFVVVVMTILLIIIAVTFLRKKLKKEQKSNEENKKQESKNQKINQDWERN